MENLIIEASQYSPNIVFDAKSHVLNIAGKSTPENTFEFYKEPIAWLTEYFQEQRTVTVIFDIPYFNSSSSRVLYDIFDILDAAHKKGSSVAIKWLYAKGNENGEETGAEFKEDFEDLNITLEAI